MPTHAALQRCVAWCVVTVSLEVPILMRRAVYLPTGKGKVLYSSGNGCEGDWYADHRHGKGAMDWLSWKNCYEECWREGFQEDEGIYTCFLSHFTGSQ